MAEVKAVVTNSLLAVQAKQKLSFNSGKKTNGFGDFLNTAGSVNSGSSVDYAPKTEGNKVKVSNTAKTQNKSESIADLNKSNAVSEDLTTKTVDTVSKEITESVKEVLNIDDETLANAMTALGFSAMDLLDNGNLTELVLFVYGSTDFTALLTNEDMMNQLNELRDILGNINWEDLTGMSKEEFMKGQITQDLSKENNDFANILSDSEIKTDAVVEDYSDIQVDEGDNDSNSEINVTVVKEDNGTKQESSEDGMADALSKHEFSDNKNNVNENNTSVQNSFIHNLNQSVNDVAQSTKPENVKMQQMIDIVNQVVEKIKVTLSNDSTSMEMQLNPEHLGKVFLSVSSKNGIMTAVFSVQSEEAKAALESQMFKLRENLESRELKVDAVEVNVSDFDFSHGDKSMNGEEQGKADNGDGKQMRFEFDEEESDEKISNEEKEAVRRRVMRDNGSQIDYTA